jgi:hypothetical protein
MWARCWLLDVELIGGAIHHQVVLEHRENFKNRSIGINASKRVSCRTINSIALSISDVSLRISL